MKKFKLYFSILILFSILSVGFINFYLNNEMGSIGKYRTGDNMYRNYNLHKYLNYFNYHKVFSKKISHSDVDFFLDFSENDIANFDSIIEISKSHRGGYIDNNSKTWRSVNLRTQDEFFSAKVKLHGSHNFIYLTGNKSFRVKLKDKKLQKFEFRLINSFKEGYFEHVFLNNQIKNAGVISPDPGKIVLVSDGNKINDMRYTEDISQNVIESQIFHKNYKIIKLNSNWNRNSPNHLSRNFHTGGYIDDSWDINDSIGFTTFNNYLTKNPSFFKSIDSREWGRYLANIFFWGQLNSYVGDNSVFIFDYNSNKLRPISRHEGPAKNIQTLNYSNFIEDTISNYNIEDNTISTWLWLLSNYDIKKYFNKSLYSLINKKNSMITELDNVYANSIEKHIYNEQFDLIKYRHSKLKEIIVNNSFVINKYLSNSYYVVNSYKDITEIYSDSDIPVEILEIFNDEILAKTELKYNRFNNDEYKSKGFKKTIDRENNFSDFILINAITKDTVNEKNITYNNFNFNKL